VTVTIALVAGFVAGFFVGTVLEGRL